MGEASCIAALLSFLINQIPTLKGCYAATGNSEDLSNSFAAIHLGPAYFRSGVARSTSDRYAELRLPLLLAIGSKVG